MSSIDDIIAEHACAKLVASYAIAADFGDLDAAARCYIADGKLTIAGSTHEGREAIRARLADQPQSQVSRHLMGTIVVDLLSPTEARGRCYLAQFRGMREQEASGPLPGERHSWSAITTIGLCSLPTAGALLSESSPPPSARVDEDAMSVRSRLQPSTAP